MKSFIGRNRHSIILRSITPAAIISICLYVFVRTLFYEFPMTWMEEIIFFFKLMIVGSFVVGSTIVGVRLFHFSILNINRRRKQMKLKLMNSLFLRKNSEHVHYPAYTN